MREIARVLGPRHRQWLVGATLLVGLVTAVALDATFPSGKLTYTTISGAVQSLMSVLVPLLGIQLAGEVRRGEARFVPTLVAGAVVAAVVGAFGAIISAAALVLGPATADNPWAAAALTTVGGPLIQVLALLVGTGLGLLIRQPVVAFVATIVIPLGLYLLLLPAYAEGWLTPFASAVNLQSGDMSGLAWLQWLVVFLLWGPGLNAVAVAHLRRTAAVG